jgi:hypothetical protein
MKTIFYRSTIVIIPPVTLYSNLSKQMNFPDIKYLASPIKQEGKEERRQIGKCGDGVPDSFVTENSWKNP